MDRRKVSLVPVIVVLTFLALTCVTAHSLTSNAPLYTRRMEQVSNKMNFLPTAMNEFAYVAEHGYTLDYDVAVNCCDNTINEYTLAPTCPYTCWDTCVNTCPGKYTCTETCPATCPATCPYTCQYTCPNTCNTCVGQFTCYNTCKVCPVTTDSC